MSRICTPHELEQVRRLSETTIAFYDRFAEDFWQGTRNHDVTQNYAAFLDAIEGDAPHSILDVGCGPGRDLGHFRSQRPAPFATRAECERALDSRQQRTRTLLSCEEMVRGGWSICGTVTCGPQDQDVCD